MRRREFIIQIAGLSGVWPLIAHAQQSTRIAKIGVLWHAGSAEEERVYLDILTKLSIILITSKAKTSCTCIDFLPSS
jgi:hypothetical protein